MERKEAQTEFDFAIWLQKSTPLNPRAVWTITHICTSAQYAQVPPGSEELTNLHGALQLIMAEVVQRVPEAELEPLKDRYRYAFAQRLYEARKAKEAVNSGARLQTADG